MQKNTQIQHNKSKKKKTTKSTHDTRSRIWQAFSTNSKHHTGLEQREHTYDLEVQIESRP